MIKPSKKLINAKRTSTKLRILAKKILTYKEFNQDHNDYCVIGYGSQLAGASYDSAHSAAFANLYRIPHSDSIHILLAKYHRLGIKEKDFEGKMHRVTREIASRALNKLADKYAAQGN